MKNNNILINNKKLPILNTPVSNYCYKELYEVTKKLYDIAIVGLGPAGANFARLLDTDKYSVAAMDKKDTVGSAGFKKSCGGLLAPDAQKALAKQNLPLPGEVLVSPQIFYVKTIDMDNNLTRNYQRFYINIDRHKFDLWMMSIIPTEVDVFSGSTVTDLQQKDGVYEINFSKNGEKQTIRAKHIIGADGANGIVSRSFFNKRENALKLSVQEWYKQGGGVPFFSCVFDSNNSDSYSWSLSKDGYFIFGGAYDRREAKIQFESQKQKLKSYGIDLGKPIKREACFLYRLRRAEDFLLGKGNVIMLGEAAGFISPSSYEGISGALNSSHILSCLFNESSQNILKRYKKATRKLRAKYVLKILKSRILCNRVLRKLIMRSGIQSMEVAE